MAKSAFLLDHEQTDKLQDAMEKFGTGSGRVIDAVLHGEGGELIRDEIMRLLPVSGREWSGKKTAAKKTKPFTQHEGQLSVTVASKTAYNYLYFPDDGSNTKRHQGQQHFMLRGAENATGEIIERCVNALIKQIGE